MKKYFMLPLGLILLMIFNSIAFAVDIEPGGFDYNNNKYGFYLVLPSGWEGYGIAEVEMGEDAYYTFLLNTTETSGEYPFEAINLFTITATTGSAPEMQEYLGENSIYKFYFSHLNGDPPSDLLDRVLEFDQIKSTFTAFEPTGPIGPLGSFSDTGGHQYDDAINYVRIEGIVEGYADGTYKPDSPINRAEFTKILMEANTEGEIDLAYTCYQTYDAGLEACAGDGECGLPVWEDFAKCVYEKTAPDITQEEFDALIKYDTCFPDVPMGEWFAKYVCLAKMAGIIGGYPDGEFKPANNINLAEALKIIFETQASMGGPVIEDTGNGEWYQKYMDTANALGLLDTINADPAHLLTRGEMAELIYLLDAVG